MPIQGKSHWEDIYRTKDVTQVSWFQQHPKLSVRFIEHTGIDKAAQIIDVGGGASTLVDDLLADGFENITVLDISAAALQVARQRLGTLASKVTWLEAEITRAALKPGFYDVWHDRAVFHFLTDKTDRERYVRAVLRAVKAGGHIIVASFGLAGPEKCSGLNVMRYSAETMHREFGDDFELVDTTTELHHTPFGTDQQFIYCYCRKF